MGMERLSSGMEVFMLESFVIIKYKGKEPKRGRIIECIKESLKMGKLMEKESLLGVMEGNIKDIMLMNKKMGLGNLRGLVERGIKGFGGMVNKMEEGKYICPSMIVGKRERGLMGSWLCWKDNEGWLCGCIGMYYKRGKGCVIKKGMVG